MVGARCSKNYILCLSHHQGREPFILISMQISSNISGGIFWQPRTFPTDPELISIGDNVMIASGVEFINHDIVAHMLNKKYDTHDFQPMKGCISIGDNVMIGAGTVILPNVRIGSNVVIGASSIVCKDIPDNVVAAGVPCRVVGDFDKLVEKYKSIRKLSTEELWKEFSMIKNM